MNHDPVGTFASSNVHQMTPIPITRGLGAWIARARQQLIRARELLRGGNLTSRQRDLLHISLLRVLAVRAVYWVAALLVADGLVLLFGEQRDQPLFGFSTAVWSALLWLVGVCPGVILLKKVSALSGAEAQRAFRRLNLGVVAWITALYATWAAGAITLAHIPSPQVGQPPHFHLGQQTFVAMTITGIVIPLILASPSLTARLVVMSIGVGVLAAAWCFSIFATNIFLYWNAGQLIIYFGLVWIVSLDERRYHLRGLVERAAREKVTTFIAALSHDLKQPLFATSLRLTLMRETSADSQVLSHIRVIESQVGYIEKIMNATLDLARLQTSTWEVRMKAISLPELLRQIAEDLQPEAEIAGLELESVTVPYTIISDPAALERIIHNMVNNALRYTPAQSERGQGKVRIECEVIELKNVVRISVIDNGIGIPQERLDDIYQEFVQIENEERNREKGFGLGLSIVRGLANLLKHRTGVTSEFGKGSCFWVEVPFAGPLPENLPRRVMEFESRANTLGSLHVAVIEDDRAVLENLTAVLNVWGCEVLACPSGWEFLQRAKAAPDLLARLDFIIADYDLTGEKGPEVVSQIRAAAGREIPAVICTAATKPDVLRLLASIDIPYFSKPVDFKHLWQTLITIRERAPPERASESASI